MKADHGKQMIFDLVRKKWLQLTPEEWVRQHLLNYLIQLEAYPAASIAVEKEVQLNDTKKRFDVVVYDRALKPFLVVECKAPYVALDRLVIDQALRYNLSLKAPFLMISNGIEDIVFTADAKVTTLPPAAALQL
ncbi:MAG: type I restriction enzyme HsdR N-terminal domain-containing protein [Sphingobacteriia bacterium]|jgi:type I site-specific restriction endonuclease|nr:type I restriction enzyme HsdR N-terminal domain-containing protein [Sphingobacteriia bacterium]